MQGIDNSLAIIGEIYDAALESARWTNVLIRIAGFVGGQATAILRKDSASRSSSALHHSGINPYYAELYSNAYWQCDPTAALPSCCDIGQIVSIPELVPYDEFRQGRFYQEWGRPQGWIDSANAVIEKSATDCLQFSVIRHESHGMVDDEMRLRMSLVIPHVRRAMLIGKMIDLKHAEVAIFTETLNGLSASLLLVDAHGRIVHANASGHALLAEGVLLHSAGGKLTADDASVERALRDAFRAVGSQDPLDRIKGIAVPLVAPGGERHVVRVLPLTSGARRRVGPTYAAVVAVFVHKAAWETPFPPEVIAKTLKLTPTELRVLLAIVEVGGVPEVAAALGIAETTVKTHLGRIFGKTGTRRQADLVKLVSGFSISVLRRPKPLSAHQRPSPTRGNSQRRLGS